VYVVPYVADLKKPPRGSDIANHDATSRNQGYLAFTRAVDVAMPGKVVPRSNDAAIGNRAKVSSSDVEVDAEKKMLHVTKDLYVSDELKAIRHLGNETRSWVRARSYSSDTLRPGLYFVKLGAVQEVKTYLLGVRPKLREAVETFIKSMPMRQQESKEKLGTLYREEDYPSPAQVRAACRIDFSWLAAGAPTSLREISDAFFAVEQEKAQRQMEFALNEIRMSIRAETLKLLDFTRERLATEDGVAKQFRAPVVRKVQSFLDMLRYRDAGDTGLEPILKELRDSVSGIDAKDVRENADFARALARRFEGMHERLSTLITDEPIRQIELDDEPAPAADAPAQQEGAEPAAAQA
jgi:hypothetical protein